MKKSISQRTDPALFYESGLAKRTAKSGTLFLAALFAISLLPPHWGGLGWGFAQPIAAGGYHSLCLCSDSTTVNKTTPVQVSALTESTAISPGKKRGSTV